MKMPPLYQYHQLPMTLMDNETKDDKKEIGKEYIYKAKSYIKVCDLIYKDIVYIASKPDVDENMYMEMVGLCNSLIFNFSHATEIYIKGLGYYSEINFSSEHSGIFEIINELKEIYENDLEAIKSLKNIEEQINNTKKYCLDVRPGGYVLDKNGKVNFTVVDNDKNIIGYADLDLFKHKQAENSMWYNLNLLENKIKKDKIIEENEKLVFG